MSEYIEKMREMIGIETLLTVGCGAIIEDEHDRVLLQKRADSGTWGIPGGLLEVGDTFESTVKREVEEETGLWIRDLQLFGIYSGEKGFATYKNGDQVFSVQIIFLTSGYEGQLSINHESQKQGFFSKGEITEEMLNPHQAPFLLDWISESAPPFIR